MAKLGDNDFSIGSMFYYFCQLLCNAVNIIPDFKLIDESDAIDRVVSKLEIFVIK